MAAQPPPVPVNSPLSYLDLSHPTPLHPWWLNFAPPSLLFNQVLYPGIPLGTSAIPLARAPCSTSDHSRNKTPQGIRTLFTHHPTLRNIVRVPRMAANFSSYMASPVLVHGQPSISTFTAVPQRLQTFLESARGAAELCLWFFHHQCRKVALAVPVESEPAVQDEVKSQLLTPLNAILKVSAYYSLQLVTYSDSNP